jgi:hypothetical protein
MTAAEAILADRPGITSPVVAGLDVLRPVCVDVERTTLTTMPRKGLKLIDGSTQYRALLMPFPLVEDHLYDRDRGLAATLTTENKIIMSFSKAARLLVDRYRFVYISICHRDRDHRFSTRPDHPWLSRQTLPATSKKRGSRSKAKARGATN